MIYDVKSIFHANCPNTGVETVMKAPEIGELATEDRRILQLCVVFGFGRITYNPLILWTIPIGKNHPSVA
jgi:hypothetical protein